MRRRERWSSVLKDSLNKLQTVVDNFEATQTDAARNNAQQTSRMSYELPEVNQCLSELSLTYPQTRQPSLQPEHKAGTARIATAAVSTEADEETKAFIISTHKRFHMIALGCTHAQIPIVKLMNSGVVESYWSCLDDFLLLARHVPGFRKHATLDEQLRFLERHTSKSSSRDGVEVRCEIHVGTLTCVRETYPSYEIMVKMCLEDMSALQTQLNKMEQMQQTANTHTMNEMETLQSRLQAEKEQRDAIMRRGQEHLSYLGQLSGTIPKYYKNGIPHYGGLNY